MRIAAIARHASKQKSDRKFDVQEGLDQITNYLYLHRDADDRYGDLYDWLSVRRGARGLRTPLPPENYLLVAEIIYDMVATEEQGEKDPEVPKTKPSQPKQITPVAAALPVQFSITSKENLFGSKSKLEASIDEASTNLAWKREPAFKVIMNELVIIDRRLAKLQSPKTPESRSERAHLTDRRNRVQALTPIIEKGLHYLLNYQYLLFPEKLCVPDRKTRLIQSMQVYVARSFKFYRRGGFLEGWKECDDKRFVVEFSLPPKRLKQFLNKTFGVPNPLALAAENQEISDLAPDLIAQFFIPELLLEIVRRQDDKRFSLAFTERQECFLSIDGWMFGPK
jgi:hypothetical protein